MNNFLRELPRLDIDKILSRECFLTNMHFTILYFNVLSGIPVQYVISQPFAGVFKEADYYIPFGGSEKESVDVQGGWYEAAGEITASISKPPLLHQLHGLPTDFDVRMEPLTVFYYLHLLADFSSFSA